ncbi:MAG: hypothetical protein K2X72_40555 [Reyranella sp.]|nr:hypothetical protein [Reyranella sp.]
MKSKKHLELARRLTLRRGVPNAPSAKEVPTEVRSNSFVAIEEPPAVDTSYAVGNVVVEWTYRVPPEEFRGFTAFLADNEAMIVASCGKLMEGVHYRGTFLVTDLGRFEFRTYWAYDTHATEKQWDKALGNANSNFAQAVAQLRSYWLKDPNASHRHMVLASLLDDKTMGAFFKFTLNTAEGLSGRAPAAARKKGKK